MQLTYTNRKDDIFFLLSTDEKIIDCKSKKGWPVQYNLGKNTAVITLAIKNNHNHRKPMLLEKEIQLK